jgi:hypothetical protein
MTRFLGDIIIKFKQVGFSRRPETDREGHFPVDCSRFA